MTLIERLESAEAGSRELDGEIACLADGFTLEVSPSGQKMYCFRNAEGEYVRPGNAGDMGLPHYTTDISAAVALVERVLPGAVWSCARISPASCRANVQVPSILRSGVSPRPYSKAPDPALALCIALLKALKALKTKEPSA